MNAMLLSLLLASTPASSNGGFVPAGVQTGSALSADFRAVLIPDGDRTTAVIQSAYVGDATDFAWIFPVPTPPQDDLVEVVSAVLVDELIAHTDPSAYWREGCDDGCGFGYGYGDKDDAGGGGGSGNTTGVAVLNDYSAGPYELVLLDAQNSGDITGWLNNAGYPVPIESEELLQWYATEGWYFLVTSLSEASEAESSRGLPCLAFSYSASPVYPIFISSGSASEQVETLVFSVGDHRMEPDGEPVILADWGEDFLGNNFTQWYRERAHTVLNDAAADSPTGRAWLLEYAGEPPHDWEWAQEDPNEYYLLDVLQEKGLLDRTDFDFVTRYHTWLSPEQMTQDLYLVQAETDDTFHFTMGTVLSHAGFTAIGGLLACLAVGRIRRRE